jgi:hypothetical protein
MQAQNQQLKGALIRHNPGRGFAPFRSLWVYLLGGLRRWEQSAAERWQSLAGKKISELDELINRVQAMKSLLQQTLQCHCLTIEDCAKVDENMEAGELGVQSCCGTEIPLSVQLAQMQTNPISL